MQCPSSSDVIEDVVFKDRVRMKVARAEVSEEEMEPTRGIEPRTC